MTKRIDLKDFFNEGFGWVCRHCDGELNRISQGNRSERSRIFDEGEAETKSPALSTMALATWGDPARRSLVCPRCGVSELADPS